MDLGNLVETIRHYLLIEGMTYLGHYGPSPDPTTDATLYFKGERESWFLSFEKFVPLRNGFVLSRHLLFIFIFKWEKFK